MKRKQRKWRVTRKQRVTECKMEGWRPRGGGRKRDKHGEEGPEQDFCFFLWFGLHANTPERIVELRELKKKMYNPGQRDGGGWGWGWRGMKREHTRTQKKEEVRD